MPTVTANGKKFTFPDGTSEQDMGLAIDDYFSNQPAAQAQINQAQSPGINAAQIQTPSAEVAQVQTPSQTITQTEQVAPLTETQIAAQQEIARQESAPPQIGMFGQIKDALGNVVRETKEAFVGSEPEATKNLPEFLGSDSGVFATIPKTTALKLSALFSITNDPVELANIIENQQIPEIAITYNINDDGDLLPVVTNKKTGTQVLLNRPGLSTTDIVQGLQQGLVFAATGGRNTILKEALAGGATQAAFETAQAASGGDFSPEEVALAGGLSGGLKAAENVVSGAFRSATGSPSQEATETLAEAASRDLPVTTTDILPPETRVGQFARKAGENTPVVGTRKVRAEQQRVRQELLDNYTDRFESNHDAIVESLRGKRELVQAKAINSRKNIVNQVQSTPLVTNNTIDALDTEIRNLTTLPNGQPRANVDEGTLSLLNRIADDVISDERFINVEQMRTSLRQKFLQTAGGNEAGVDKQIQKRLHAAMTKDMDEVVKDRLTPNEFRQWKKSNAIYGREAQKLGDSRLKVLFNEGKEVSADTIRKKIFSSDDVVRKDLFKGLNAEGRKNARGAIINNMVDKASRTGELSVNQFLSEARRNKKVIKSFFKGRDLKEFQGLMRALEVTKRAQDAAVSTNTGQDLIPYLTGGGLVLNLPATLSGLIASGGMARIYESKPVRNILLRLANTPKGSSNFDRVLTKLDQALTAAAQGSTETEADFGF